MANASEATVTEQTVPTIRIEVADCFDFLATLPDGSVDCVVPDPAYSDTNQHMSFGRGRIVMDTQL
jgi:hypothetical protein